MGVGIINYYELLGVRSLLQIPNILTFFTEPSELDRKISVMQSLYLPAPARTAFRFFARKFVAIAIHPIHGRSQQFLITGELTLASWNNSFDHDWVVFETKKGMLAKNATKILILPVFRTFMSSPISALEFRDFLPPQRPYLPDLAKYH